MDSYEIVKAQPVHVILTQGDIDALVTAGHAYISTRAETDPMNTTAKELVSALQKLDRAVNE